MSPAEGASAGARPWRSALGAALCGALAAAGQPPLFLWPLAILGVAGVLHLAAGPRGGRLAALAGAVYGVAAMHWIVDPFFVEPERYGWLSPLAILGMGGGMAAFWGLPVALALRLAPADPPARALAAALGLLVSEIARGTLFTGFPWALLGHALIAAPAGQAAALVGGYGLSLLVVLPALGLALWPRARRAGLALLALGVLLLGAGTVLGAARLRAPLAPAGPVLRLVQPNAPQALKWHPDHARAFFERHLALSALPLGAAALGADESGAGERGAGNMEAAARDITPPGGAPLRPGPGPRPALVIWPETAVPFWLGDPGTEGALAMIAAAAGAPVAFGIQRAEGMRYFNSLLLLGPDGAERARYDKFHLVPFGEYIPWGDALARFGITAFAARAGHGYSPGPGARVLDLGPALGTAQPLICYEAVFPQDLRAAPRRPDWLLQITNDAWFGRHVGPQQHLAQGRLRAIETGLPLARAANTGISALVGPRGELLAALPMDRAGVIDAPLPRALPPTPYAALGDLPLVCILVAGLAALGLARRRRARRLPD